MKRALKYALIFAPYIGLAYLIVQNARLTAAVRLLYAILQTAVVCI